MSQLGTGSTDRPAHCSYRWAQGCCCPCPYCASATACWAGLGGMLGLLHVGPCWSGWYEMRLMRRAVVGEAARSWLGRWDWSGQASEWRDTWRRRRLGEGRGRRLLASGTCQAGEVVFVLGGRGRRSNARFQPDGEVESVSVSLADHRPVTPGNKLNRPRLLSTTAHQRDPSARQRRPRDATPMLPLWEAVGSAGGSRDDPGGRTAPFSYYRIRRLLQRRH